MRVVHLGSSVGLPTQRAHSFQIMNTCEAFASCGMQVHLLSADPPESDRVESSEDVFALYGVEPSFEIHPLGCWDCRRQLAHRLPRMWRFLRAITFSIHAYLHILRRWNDAQTILYSRDRFTSYLLLLSGRLVRAQHVFESHTFLAGRRRLILVFFLRRLDRLVVLTSGLKQRYVEAGVPENRVLPLSSGVDLKRFLVPESRSECRRRTKLPAERLIIGYVGNFRNSMGMEKGIPELMRAQGLLLERYPDRPPLLVCVGGPSECVPAYERIARESNVSSEHYRFVAFVRRNDVPYWMRACDILTIPWSWNTFSAFETSPLKLGEYMASRVPIVASDLPSLREVLVPDQNAVLTRPGSPEALADSLARLLDDPQLRRRLAARAFEDVQDLTWVNRAKKILAAVTAGA